MRKTSAFLAVFSLVTIAPSIPVRAQGPTTGAIDGVVTDTAGVPLPGVRLEARSPSLQGWRPAVTDGSGRYRMPSLPPGLYTVSATLDGFVSQEEIAIRVA